MSESEERGWKSSARGDAAWKEARERVASRNADARKSAKSRRDAFERERKVAGRAARRRRTAS